MEHRNSTVITSTSSLAEGGQERNIGTVAHEFFHAWNVERIRPKSLEPFDFGDANLSGELWFAEGFTSYYTYLTLRRAELMSTENYAKALGRLLSYVVNSPGRELFDPVEMSYQAPFVDAATSVDEVNRENTYTDYYSYGNVLGLVLDLSLRRRDDGKNLDDFMRLVWERRGKKELPYTLQDLQELLSEYSDEEFADSYFKNYVYDSQLPDFGSLLADFGIHFERAQPNKAHLGANITVKDGRWLIASNPTRGSALYEAGMSKGDLIRSMDGRPTDGKISVSDFMSTMKPGQKVKVSYLRHGKAGEQELTLGSDPSFQTGLLEEMDRATRKRMENWLIRDSNSDK
jgi:predicted metalloprotease with PDZ domain